MGSVDRSGKEVLLLIDDVKVLLRTLIIFRNREINLSSFKTELEKILGKKLSLKYAEGYFYSATVFKLLLPLSKKGVYKISTTVVLMCSMLDNHSKKQEYQKILSTLLLTNERKGQLFQNFLKFVDPPKKINEIYERFGEVTGKSLIIWSAEAGMILKHEPFIGRVKTKTTAARPTLEDFWNELKSAYQQIKTTEVFGMKRIFVDIGELRLFISCKMNFFNIEEFDEYLRMLLETDYGKYISLHGAPSYILEQSKDLFKYKEKVYLYLSIGDEAYDC